MNKFFIIITYALSFLSLDLNACGVKDKNVFVSENANIPYSNNWIDLYYAANMGNIEAQNQIIHYTFEQKIFIAKPDWFDYREHSSIEEQAVHLLFKAQYEHLNGNFYALTHNDHELILKFSQEENTSFKLFLAKLNCFLPNNDSLISFDWIKDKALQNDPQNKAQAQFALAQAYYFKKNIPKEEMDHADQLAFHYYECAANQDHAGAQYLLGWMYTYHKGIPEEHVRKADQLAFSYFKLAADQHHANAQFVLGMLYYTRKGIPEYETENPDQLAYYYFKEATEQDHDDAQCALGCMYQQKLGIPNAEISQADLLAVYYYKRAANRPNAKAKAQLNLALMYSQYIGIPENEKENAQELAYKYFKLAADRYDPHPKAQLNLGIMYYNKKGIPEHEVNQAPQLAFNYIKHAAKVNFIEAQYRLGFLYEMGYGVDRNYKEAINWYTKAANQEHDKASIASMKLTDFFNALKSVEILNESLTSFPLSIKNDLNEKEKNNANNEQNIDKKENEVEKPKIKQGVYLLICDYIARINKDLSKYAHPKLSPLDESQIDALFNFFVEQNIILISEIKAYKNELLCLDDDEDEKSESIVPAEEIELSY